ncbi:MAG: type II secretion system F family protein [Sedimentisphaerales bacterium]|nr:type II secretion system F family protein [Sedimentisphaerales bacterium]
MATFQYEALDAKGQEIKAEIEALNNKEAISKIRNLGYFPTKVKSKGGGAKKITKEAGPVKKRGGGGKVKIKYLTQFARQLSTLQDAGLSILRSLRVLEQQQKAGTFRRVIGYVADDIEGGETLSGAMAKYPKTFDRLFVNMVAAGEAGGVLDLILSRLADFMEKAAKLKSRVKGAMIYPAVVMFAAFGIVMGLMIMVIPKFTEVLTEMTNGAKLPALTTGLMAVSSWIAFQYGWAVLVGIPFAIMFVMRFLKKFQPCRLVLDMITLRMPVMGQIVSKTSIARWTRTLGTLIGAGVPILEAINITRETAGNEVFANMLGKVHYGIRQGDTFANPLKQSKTVDGIVTNMVEVGEETGDLDKMLLKVADNYDEDVDVLVGSLMSLLEPVMIIVLGTIVGTIVLAIFLPMITIITSLSSQ